MQPEDEALAAVRATDAERQHEGGEAVDVSEDRIAAHFTATYAETFRYCAPLGGWHSFDGIRWAKDETMLPFDKARAECRAIAAAMPRPDRQSSRIRSAATVAAVVKLASADRAHAIVSTRFDADPLLLNTPGGTVDLRTGILRPHRADDYCTKATSTTPGGEAPRFRQFLHEVTGGNDDLQTYLQRMAGYLLTGLTSEHALFFVYGTGGNGKSVFLNLLLSLLGQYAQNAPMSLFTETRHEGHPTELAMLRGARVVVATETEEGRRWAESRIKVMTGGDPITARFMRADFFTYTPQFKPVIAGNHRPRFRNPDEAIRRRLHLIPFTQRFATPDRELPAKLHAEAGGILAWMIAGCLMWQRDGLQPPDVVRLATSDYLEAEDSIGAWLTECATEDVTAWTSSVELFESWNRWAVAGGEHPRDKKYLAEQLSSRGFLPKRDRTGNQRGFMGIRVAAWRPSDASDIDFPYRRSTRAHDARTHAPGQRRNAEQPSDVSEAAASDPNSGLDFAA